MEKLNKLQINPEKLMKNEELLALRGGYDGDPMPCSTGTNYSSQASGLAYKLRCSTCDYGWIKVTGDSTCSN